MTALALGSVPRGARIAFPTERGDLYPGARGSDDRRPCPSRALLASLAVSQPGQVDIVEKALIEAVGAGQMDLALKLAAGASAEPAK